MTSKQKAKKLVFNFAYAIRDSEDKEGFFTNIKKAKQCALILVNEILNTIGDKIFSEYEYWQEVKKELDKL